MLMNPEISKYPEPTTIEFSKRISIKGGGSKNVTIEKCENGFITTICMDIKKENGDWEYTNKKYISATNPLKKENSVLSLKEFLKESM